MVDRFESAELKPAQSVNINDLNCSRSSNWESLWRYSIQLNPLTNLDMINVLLLHLYEVQHSNS